MPRSRAISVQKTDAINLTTRPLVDLTAHLQLGIAHGARLGLKYGGSAHPVPVLPALLSAYPPPAPGSYLTLSADAAAQEATLSFIQPATGGPSKAIKIALADQAFEMPLRLTRPMWRHYGYLTGPFLHLQAEMVNMVYKDATGKEDRVLLVPFKDENPNTTPYARLVARIWLFNLMTQALPPTSWALQLVTAKVDTASSILTTDQQKRAVDLALRTIQTRSQALRLLSKHARTVKKAWQVAAANH